jgi:type III pantothenate kinase
MTGSALVLAVDIGNSNTRLGLVDCDTLACLAAVSFPTSAAEQRFEAAWDSLRARARNRPIDTAAIASVAGAAGEDITAMVSEVVPGAVGRLSGVAPLPIRIGYATPRSLGADRIADAIYCAAKFRGKSCSIIDAGTAVTVDYLARDGVFTGGTILPGIDLQLRSLHHSTASLPPLEYHDDPLEIPGADTRGSILGGVVHGLAGAIEHIVGRYRGLAGGVDTVVATGGAWLHLAPLTAIDAVYVPEATLVGTALAAQRTSTSPLTELPA